MHRVSRIREGLYIIDLDFQGEQGVIASYLLESSGEYALIEVGPTSTLDALLQGIQEIGIEPESISKLLVTHIHLDHAGAAGSLVQRFPHMRLHVHEVGASHMIDPSRLLASAERIYGDQMGPLWGEVLPVPEDNVFPLTDGDRVSVGTTNLTAWYTPGHASHHVAYEDQARAEIFTGDVAIIRLQEFDYLRPATPPPDIDLDLWTESLERLRKRQSRALHLTHFGTFRDVDAHLLRTRERLIDWARFVEELHAAGVDRDAIKEALRAKADNEVRSCGGDEATARRYELAAPSGMSVDGYLRYFTKRARAADERG